MNDKQRYELFKNRLINEISIFQNGDVILLSGGVDSGLILAIATKIFNKKPFLSTIIYNPTFDLNQNDYEISCKLADYYKLPFQTAWIAFDEESIETLKPYRGKMKNSHLCLGFHRALENMQNRAVWTGQNADALYSFEAKNNRPGCILKRISYMLPFLKNKAFRKNLRYTQESSDSLIIKYAAEFNGCKEVKYPYSSPAMIDFFKHLPVMWRDIFSPKRYSYMFLKELLGKDYDRLYKGMKLREWEKQIMTTNFGLQLKRETNADSLSEALRVWWKK